MSSVRRLDMDKLRGRRIIATALLTAVTVAFLLLKDTSAQGSATQPAAQPSYQAAGGVPVRPQEE